MAEVKRLNYFNSQFLEENDFIDEQKYHRYMRHLHNRELHSWGIVSGLEVTQIATQKLSISSGVAIDKNGHEIVLPSNQERELSNLGREVDVWITIQYAETKDEADRRQVGAVDNYIRTTERPNLIATKDFPPNDGSVIVLAQIRLDANANISNIDSSKRKFASAKIATGAVKAEQLAPEVSSQITAATEFIKNYDLGKQVVTSSITFNERSIVEGSQSSAPIAVPDLTFQPRLILVGGLSRWILSAQESYSGSIFGFVNNKKPPRNLQCFCSGTIKTSATSWLPITEEGPFLCKVTYQDRPVNKQSTLIVDISNISAQGMTVELRRNIAPNSNPIDSFQIQLWLLCLG
ncbi:MAG: hypothetical protein HC862_08035 [Scytonema sp. RU_4_4]|nr:hypothetical protein [Scytonema sp. RU_4_4]NJR76707.1 hypothetical protein [Scytonema sp. CRU_2_7]